MWKGFTWTMQFVEKGKKVKKDVVCLTKGGGGEEGRRTHLSELLKKKTKKLEYFLV